MVSERIKRILSDISFDFSITGLLKIHFLLFNGIFGKAGKFRNKFNPRKKEFVLQGRSVKYADSSKIIVMLEKIIFEEQKFDYTFLTTDEKIKHLCQFFSELWKIHPFYDGNTRSTTLFMILRMKKLGFNIDNILFEQNAAYLRDCLVRSAFENRNFPREFSFLEKFLLNVVNGIPVIEVSRVQLQVKGTL